MRRVAFSWVLVLAAGCPAPAEVATESDADTDSDTDADSDTDTDTDSDTDTEPDSDTDTQTCDDGSEDNDTVATAAPLPTSGTSLSVSEGDDDYFTVTLQGWVVQTFEVRFQSADGDIDLSLDLPPEAAGTVTTAQTPDGEAVSFINSSPLSVEGTLRVTTSEPGACVPYTVWPDANAIETCTDPDLGAKRVFLTSQTYTGDLMSPLAAASGLAGADAICQQHADDASLGGTWVAWLSDGTTHAIDRIADVGPWSLRDQCTQIFASKASITASGPEGPFHMDEAYGTVPIAEARFWSGTDGDGLSTPMNCSGWTGDSFVGAEGGKGSPADWDHATDWTDWGTGDCGVAERLLCFEQ